MNIVYKICFQEPNMEEEIYQFLSSVDDYFDPKLSDRLDLKQYSHKLWQYAHIAVALADSKIVGLYAFYFNEAPRYSFGTMMATLKEYRVFDVGIMVEEIATKYCKEHKSQGLECEVKLEKKSLIRYRQRMGFEIVKEYIQEGTNKKCAYLRLNFERPFNSPEDDISKG